MRLSARRVAKLRAQIEANRCDVGPGLTHRWEQDSIFDPVRYGAQVQFRYCVKCSETDGL